MRWPSSFIRTVTVGSGIGPDLLTLRCTGGARGLVRAIRGTVAPTAGGELHPALKTLRVVVPADRRRILSPGFPGFGRDGCRNWNAASGAPVESRSEADSRPALRLPAQVQEQRPADCAQLVGFAPGRGQRGCM